MSLAKKSKEFVAVSTPDEFILCIEFPDGRIEKSYERRKITEDKIEVIQHRNRDRNGNYYTTRNVYHWKEKTIWLGGN